MISTYNKAILVTITFATCLGIQISSRAVTIAGMFTYQLLDEKMTPVKGSYTVDRTENGDFLGGSLDIGRSSTVVTLDRIIGEDKNPDQLFNMTVPVKVNLGGGSVSVGPEVIGKNAAIPEPLTILGSGLALGFGAYFKKEYSKKQKKAKTKA